MLSFGIEYDRAFSIAFWSARLAAGSAPPSRAATMIARESFEKRTPRFLSAAPFLCLIDDHLLCPDIYAPVTVSRGRGGRPPVPRPPPPPPATPTRGLAPPPPLPWSGKPDRRLRRLPHCIEEQLVHACVVRQLWMERSRDDAAVAHEHRPAVVLRQHVHAGTDVVDPRRADEDTAQRLVRAREL